MVVPMHLPIYTYEGEVYVPNQWWEKIIKLTKNVV